MQPIFFVGWGCAGDLVTNRRPVLIPESGSAYSFIKHDHSTTGQHTAHNIRQILYAAIPAPEKHIFPLSRRKGNKNEAGLLPLHHSIYDRSIRSSFSAIQAQQVGCYLDIITHKISFRGSARRSLSHPWDTYNIFRT
jgi:hypothetical protein